MRHKSFKSFFESARKSPTYWLAGLEIQFEERIHRYKKRQKQTPIVEKKKNYGSKIRALKECLQDVRREMENAAKPHPLKKKK
jgi:hypothetical protein